MTHKKELGWVDPKLKGPPWFIRLPEVGMRFDERDYQQRSSVTIPKGPCAQIVDTLAPQCPNRDYFKAKVEILFWAHGPIGYETITLPRWALWGSFSLQPRIPSAQSSRRSRNASGCDEGGSLRLMISILHYPYIVQNIP